MADETIALTEVMIDSIYRQDLQQFEACAQVLRSDEQKRLVVASMAFWVSHGSLWKRRLTLRLPNANKRTQIVRDLCQSSVADLVDQEMLAEQLDLIVTRNLVPPRADVNWTVTSVVLCSYFLAWEARDWRVVFRALAKKFKRRYTVQKI